MKTYHKVWLSTHPKRSEAWLLDKLSEGFDVHHLDGDHENNEASNLVLIEASDHMRLHGLSGPDGQPILRALAKQKSEARRVLGRQAYEKALQIRAESGSGAPLWRPIAADMGFSCQKVFSAAKVWAIENSLEWPLRHKSKKPIVPRLRPIRLGKIIPA